MPSVDYRCLILCKNRYIMKRKAFKILMTDERSQTKVVRLQ